MGSVERKRVVTKKFSVSVGVDSFVLFLLFAFGAEKEVEFFYGDSRDFHNVGNVYKG